MMENKNTKYLACGIAGSLVLGGLIFFLMKGEEPTSVSVASEQSLTKVEEKVEEVADKLAGIERSGFFAYNSAELDDVARTTLTAWASKLSENRTIVLNIEGHCDERGSEVYNMKLGKMRAEAVKNFLVGQGVEASRLHTISFGESRPQVSGSTESAFSQNRRFDLKEVSAFAQR